jgi:Ca2+-binding EF-hand superfamily protein
MQYHMDVQVPVSNNGQRNQDFQPMLPGHDFRQPACETKAQKKSSGTLKKGAQSAEDPVEAGPAKLMDPKIADNPPDRTRQKGFKAAPRWNPKWWFKHPDLEQHPNQKEPGETWNHRESEKVQGTLKAQDRLMRTVRGPEHCGTPSEDGRTHPLDYDNEQYYPERDIIDGVDDQPSNDFQVRAVNLPDFYNPPPPESDSRHRMMRIREVLRQRYGGRPGLLNVFKNYALTKSGYIFPKDLQTVLDQMGIKAAQAECHMLVNAVDKDLKGAVTFDEFADMIYGSDVEIGGQMFQSQERHVRHVTKSLVDMLVHRGPALGKAFCEIDPERRYEINKTQFANALSTASNHISKQAIDFLWAAQFPGENGATHMCEDRTVDWRGFMSQLAKFANEHRVPTPCCIQGRKRQYDLLQRSAALTGGELTELDLNRPDQDAEDEVAVVADQLVHKSRKLPNLPRDAAFLTPHYVEFIRTKASRTEGALKNRLPEWRLRQLLKARTEVTQDELIEVINNELLYPTQVPPVPAQPPLYKIEESTVPMGTADVLTLEPEQAQFVPQHGPDHDAQIAALNFGPSVSSPRAGVLKESIPAYLKLSKGDIEAYVSTMRMNKADEVDVEQFIYEVYRPACEKSSVEEVNDGLNRQLRLNPPPRERPPNAEVPRYENYWQARYMMELINDSLMTVEVSNGGKLKPSKAFKRLDTDGDGHLTLTDLQKACERFKIPYTNADLHAVFSALDKQDVGSIDIGEFTRNYEVHQGSLLDNLQKPVYGAVHEGGVMVGGPLVEREAARNREFEGSSMQTPPGMDSGYPPKAGGSPTGSQQSAGSQKSGSRCISAPPSASVRSALSAAGQIMAMNSSIPVGALEYGPGMPTGGARITDVIRARTDRWKPQKSELFTTMPPNRFSSTIFPDTRHITEPSVPLSGAFLADSERFKTTNATMSIFSVPDYRTPQQADSLKKNAQNEFRVERIRQRQREFTERCHVANEASREFEEKKIARKAMNQLNYERRVRMACT